MFLKSNFGEDFVYNTKPKDGQIGMPQFLNTKNNLDIPHPKTIYSLI